MAPAGSCLDAGSSAALGADGPLFSAPCSPVLAPRTLLCPLPPRPRNPAPEGAEMLAADPPGSRSFPPSLLRSVRALAKLVWTAKGSGEPGAVVPGAKQSDRPPHWVGGLPSAGAAADASARCRQPLTCLERLPRAAPVPARPPPPALRTLPLAGDRPSLRSAPLRTLPARFHLPARQLPALFVSPAPRSAPRRPFGKGDLRPRAKQGSGGAAPSSRSVPIGKKGAGPADKPLLSLLSFILRTLIFSFICPSRMSVQNWSSQGAIITSTGIQAAGLRLAGAPLTVAKQQLAGKQNTKKTKKAPLQQSNASLPPAPAFRLKK